MYLCSGLYELAFLQGAFNSCKTNLKWENLSLVEFVFFHFVSFTHTHTKAKRLQDQNMKYYILCTLIFFLLSEFPRNVVKTSVKYKPSIVW